MYDNISAVVSAYYYLTEHSVLYVSDCGFKNPACELKEKSFGKQLSVEEKRLFIKDQLSLEEILALANVQPYFL